MRDEKLKREIRMTRKEIAKLKFKVVTEKNNTETLLQLNALENKLFAEFGNEN